ncbi:MAG: nucleotidyltransferase family protein [Nanoarchaeota archaeon]|nr:nucleotidyltransferase family protein [Nanoarchaeota archaeon]
MDVLILAAGYATRLYPLTLDIPKPLLDIGGKPILDHIIDKIKDKVDKVHVITNNKFYSHFLEWAKDKENVNIVNDQTLTNEDRLGAIGDIHYFIKKNNFDDELMVIAGDNLLGLDFDKFFRFFREKDSSILAIYDLIEKEKLANKFGVVELDDECKVIGFEEKPPQPKTSLTATACYMFKQKDVALLEKCVREQEKLDNTGDFIKFLASNSNVYGFVFDEVWYDIGSKEDLAKVRELKDCDL